MRAKQFYAAIIGCGRMGYSLGRVAHGHSLLTHCEGYASHARVRLVAVAECDPAKRRMLHETKLRVYADHRELLRSETIDLLSICTPPVSHHEICIEASDRVGVVFCEKPMATNLRDAAQMVSACRQHDTRIAVNHSRRWDAALGQAKDRMPDIGEIVSATARCNVGLMNTGTHLIDTLRFLFGEVTQVRGQLLLDGNQDPGGTAELTFQDGFSVNVESSGYQYKCFEILAHGSRGVLSWDETSGEGLGVFLKVKPPDRDALSLKRQRLLHPKSKPMIARAIANLVECLDGKARPACDGVDGYKAVEVVAAWHLSDAIGGRPVALPIKAGKGLDLVLEPRQTSFTRNGKL